MKLSAQIKYHRQRLGLTQAELATRARTGQQLISDLETGKNLTPAVSTLTRVAKALGRNLEINFTEKLK